MAFPRRVVAALVLTTATLLSTSANADDGILGTSLSGTCNGVVDSQCRYCSYHGGLVGEPLSFCANGWDGFAWRWCTAWANGFCHVYLAGTEISCVQLPCP